MDTHALSEPAKASALEVLAAHGVEVMVDEGEGYTPTPVISRSIIAHNRRRKEGLADGIIITPSHNPPQDGGLKYNPPNGGPADSTITKWIQDRANQLLRSGWSAIRRVPLALALKAPSVHQIDYVRPYVTDLSEAIDLDAIRAANIPLASNPLGGAPLANWERINDIYDLDIAIATYAWVLRNAVALLSERVGDPRACLLGHNAHGRDAVRDRLFE